MQAKPTLRGLLATVVAFLCALSLGGVGQARQVTPAAAAAEALPNYLYGSDLVRARAIVKKGGALHDYRVDRGKIKALSGGNVTLKERDNSVVTIPVSTAAKIQVNGRQASAFAALKVGMSAIVVRDGESPAEMVQASGRALPTAWLSNTYFGPPMVRLEAYVKSAGVLHDYRLDRGRIRSIAPGTLTLRERDGLDVPVSISPTARIRVNGRVALFRALRRGMEATTVQDGDEPAESVVAVSKR